MSKVLLGINIDHVATLRNARGTTYPELLEAAEIVTQAGADSITIHLREDRRHIIDADVERICQAQLLPVNLEMAATNEMLLIALKHKPQEVCLVPEKRAELTTEGGLDVLSQQAYLESYIEQLKNAGIIVSLFIDPDPDQIQASVNCGADIVELHTGRYAEFILITDQAEQELQRLRSAAQLAHKLGLTVNAGHGLTLNNTQKIVQLPYIHCLNIGHAIIARAVFIGLAEAVKEMRVVMEG